MTAEVRPMFTVFEIADRVCVSKRTVRRWIAAGKLRAHRFGRTVRIAESDFHAFLAGSTDWSKGT